MRLGGKEDHYWIQRSKVGEMGWLEGRLEQGQGESCRTGLFSNLEGGSTKNLTLLNVSVTS